MEEMMTTAEDMPPDASEKAVETPVVADVSVADVPAEAPPVAAEEAPAPVTEPAPDAAPMLPEVSEADLDSGNVALLAAEAHSLRAQHDADQEEIATLKARLAAAGLA